MKISVAMCTYQGSRHLNAQMESILAQTRQPYELVVCDDGSTDNTVEMLRSRALTSGFPIRVTVNSPTLGVVQNFEKAIRLCSGDIVVLSDQDDVWRLDKLACMEKMFVDHPEIGGFFSDALVVDEGLRPMGYTMWEYVDFSSEERSLVLHADALDVLLRGPKVTGATLAFRLNLREDLLPIPRLWMHDAWISLMIAATSQLSIIDEPLIKYRQHSANQIGAKKKGMRFRFNECAATDRKQYYRDEIKRYEEAFSRVASKPALTGGLPSRISKLQAKLNHLKIRSQLPESKLLRVPVICRGLLAQDYRRYSASWQVAVKDLLLNSR
ncbi:MAG: glycosyltransferase family 2 protein [Syntrophobacteraceae bacterium]